MLIETPHADDFQASKLEATVRNVLGEHLPISFAQEPLGTPHCFVIANSDIRITTSLRLNKLTLVAYYMHIFGHLALGHAQPLIAERPIDEIIPVPALKIELHTESWLRRIMSQLMNPSVSVSDFDTNRYSWNMEESPEDIQGVFSGLMNIFSRGYDRRYAEDIRNWADSRLRHRKQQLKEFF